MIWWVAATAVVGVIGVANAVLGRLRNSAGTQRQRWADEYTNVQNKAEYYDRRIRESIFEARHSVKFQYLTQLHHESGRTANTAYNLLTDAKVSLDAVGQAIYAAKEQRDRLIAEKRRLSGRYSRSEIEQEIKALIDLRSCLFPDKDELKAQRNYFHQQVSDLNVQTRILKNQIRDTCGPQGLDWFRRLNRRASDRRDGITGTSGDVRVMGEIKWFDSQKGFGFISPFSASQDIFVSSSNLRYGSSLVEGEIVDFVIRYGDKGPWAFDVEVC